MIKAEVVFDGCAIRIGKHSIHFGRDGDIGIFRYDHQYWGINESPIELFDDLEDAIRYCMEQSK